MFCENLKQALTIAHPYERDARLGETNFQSTSTPAGVLLLFAKDMNRQTDEYSLLLTKRTCRVKTHKGQIAFPGGMTDLAEDPQWRSGNSGGAREIWVNTALRETEEEIGISPALIEVLGYLPPLNTVTGFRVTPVLGMLQCGIQELELKINPEEIDEIFWVSWNTLSHPDTCRQESYLFQGVNYSIHVYSVGGHRIWGATAEIMRNLIERLRRVT